MHGRVCGLCARDLLPLAAAHSNGCVNYNGGMAERFKAVVLKTTVAVMSPGVRIPLPPPAVIHTGIALLLLFYCGEVA
jgi:hypothetical protein